MNTCNTVDKSPFGKTGWIDGKLKPVRKGVYQRLLNYAHDYEYQGICYAYWDGQYWRGYCWSELGAIEDRNIKLRSGHQNDLPWRGVLSENSWNDGDTQPESDGLYQRVFIDLPSADLEVRYAHWNSRYGWMQAMLSRSAAKQTHSVSKIQTGVKWRSCE